MDSNRVTRKKSFFVELFSSTPICETARYLTVWTFLTALIYLIIDVVIDKKIEKKAYKIYKNTPYLHQKYSFEVFLEHLYSVLGHNKSYKYIKFFIEIMLLPFGIYFYNYACTKGMESLNYVLLGLYLFIFINKMLVVFSVDNDVNNEVSKSYL